MAQVKHFVGYDTDAGDVWIDDQTLHEVYVAPFAAAVQAGVASLMCSYNRLNGKFACGNESTLTGILRDELGFKGFVTSDWGATHAVNFINAGLDMEMPGPPRQGNALPLPSFFDSEPPPPSARRSPLQASLNRYSEDGSPRNPLPSPSALRILASSLMRKRCRRPSRTAP